MKMYVHVQIMPVQAFLLWRVCSVAIYAFYHVFQWVRSLIFYLARRMLKKWTVKTFQ